MKKCPKCGAYSNHDLGYSCPQCGFEFSTLNRPNVENHSGNPFNTIYSIGVALILIGLLIPIMGHLVFSSDGIGLAVGAAIGGPMIILGIIFAIQRKIND